MLGTKMFLNRCLATAQLLVLVLALISSVWANAEQLTRWNPNGAPLPSPPLEVGGPKAAVRANMSADDLKRVVKMWSGAMCAKFPLTESGESICSVGINVDFLTAYTRASDAPLSVKRDIDDLYARIDLTAIKICIDQWHQAQRLEETAEVEDLGSSLQACTKLGELFTSYVASAFYAGSQGRQSTTNNSRACRGCPTDPARIRAEREREESVARARAQQERAQQERAQQGASNPTNLLSAMRVYVCYSPTAGNVQGCESRDARLCNNTGEVRKVQVVWAKGLTSSGSSPETYHVPVGANATSGPKIGEEKYMDGYCRDYRYTIISIE